MSQASNSQLIASSTSLFGASSTQTHREVLGNSLTQWSDERVSNHWKRNKRASIDLLELPVAVDRQLEDQRLIMERNRNPQLNVPTKVDKVRSEQIIAKVGATRAVAVKAAVLNKIVREASGINTYVITAPPRSVDDEPEDIHDPDTNPHFKSYAKETKKKPQIMSFGHRPRSASRTFNPSTMRFRMRHGEMIKAGRDGQYGFGLPVGILAKILKAPKIGENMFNPAQTPAGPPSVEAESSRHDPHDLFSMPDERPEGFKGEAAFESASELQESSIGMESWISPTQQSLDIGKVRPGSKRSKGAKDKGGISQHVKTGGGGAIDGDDMTVNSQHYNKELHDKPWDSAHHNVRLSHKELYNIKKSVMPNQPITLTERMTRFSQKTIADELTPFCRGKQDLDMQILRAGPSAPPPTFEISPPKGQPRFTDPNDLNLNYVKKRREGLLQKEERKFRAEFFQNELRTVPKVQYHPQSLNMQIQNGAISLKDIGPQIGFIPPVEWQDFKPPSKLELFLHEKNKTHHEALALKTNSLHALSLSKPGNSSANSITSIVPSLSSASSSAIGIGGIVSDVEADLFSAMRRAKKGDTSALHRLYMGKSDSERVPQSQLDQWHRESEELTRKDSVETIELCRVDLEEDVVAAKASVEALLQLAAENKAKDRQATAEARKRREEEETAAEAARLVEQERLIAEENQRRIAEEEAAREEAARLALLEREKAARAEAEARRLAASTPKLPEPQPVVTVSFSEIRAWDLFNTGNAFDAQDPAVRLYLEPGAKLIGKTARMKDAGTEATFPEQFSFDIPQDAYVAGGLELRVEVVSVDATGLISKHVGSGSKLFFSIYGEGLPAYDENFPTKKAAVKFNLANANKKIDKGFLEMQCALNVPKPLIVQSEATGGKPFLQAEVDHPKSESEVVAVVERSESPLAVALTPEVVDQLVVDEEVSDVTKKSPLPSGNIENMTDQ